MNARVLARRIEHTLLRPDATRSDVERLCDEAIEHGFLCVCMKPMWVPLAAVAVASAPANEL